MKLSMKLPMNKPIFNSYVLVTVVALVFLTGCSTSQLDRSAEARSSSRQSLPELPDSWAMAQEQMSDAEIAWLASLNDPVLNALVDEALLNNRNLQAASANVDNARALVTQASSVLLPQLNLAAGSSDASGSGNLNIGLQTSWEIDLWGRLRSGNLAAYESLVAAEADFQNAQRSLAANVARTYFVTIDARNQLNNTKKNIETLVEINRIVQAQFDNGLADSQALSLAKSDLASAKDSLYAQEGAYRDSLRGFELLLGRYPAADLEVTESLPAVPSTPSMGLPADILENRLDLIAAERRIAAAFNQVDQAKVARLPSFSLTGSAGGASNSLSNVLSPSNIAWQATSSLLAPLFDGGRLEAQVKSANADQKAAIASYSQQALTAFSEVEQSLDQGTVLRQRQAAINDAFVNAEEAFRVAENQFKEGETSLLDLLSVQQRVFTAESNLSAIKRSQLTQFIDLNQALGGSWN